LEKISVAEDTVAGLQDKLATVGSVLETTEQIVAEGQKAGRCFRRLFKAVVLISIVVIVLMVVKKVMGGRSSDEVFVEEAAVEEVAAEEALVEEAEIDEEEVEGDGEAS
jgi:uncharacterized membrane protein